MPIKEGLSMEYNNAENAKRFCAAIRILANNPDAIQNLESYLSNHFDIWLKEYANTPENITSELWHFSNIFKED